MRSIFKKKYELYRFVEGDRVTTLTNSNKFQTFNDEVYAPSTIERTSIKLMSDMEKNSISVTLDLDHDLSKRYMGGIVESAMYLTVFENFDGQYLSLWSGRLTGVKISGDTVEFSFESSTTLSLRSGAYRKYQRTCPHALYSKQCAVDKDSFTKLGFIASATTKLTFSAFLEGTESAHFFNGGEIGGADGIMRYIVDASTDGVQVPFQKKTVISRTQVQSTIVEHKIITLTVDGSDYVFEYEDIMPYDGNTGTTEEIEDLFGMYYSIKVFNDFYGGYIGRTVSATAGCDKRTITCSKKFKNIENFGGFPLIPKENPFVGSIK